MSGGGHNATLINGATYNNENGGSIVLDGGTQYVSIPGTSSSPWAFGQNGTIEQWVYVNGNNGNNNRFWCVLNSSSSLDAYLYGSTYNIGFHGGSVITSTAIPQGVWTHLVVTYTSGTIKVYFNGIEQGLTGTTTGYNITTTSELSVGDLYVHGQNYELNGSISAMRIYNRALSAAEIAQNYDALKVRYTSYTNTFTPLCGGGSGKVEVLCVAGGGGGGRSNSGPSGSPYGGAGGGAGGLLYNSALTVTSNTGIGVTIGAGGTGGSSNNTQGLSGGNSLFSSLIVIGGGGGGASGGTTTGLTGGSGGGAAYPSTTSASGVTGQGNAGGANNGVNGAGAGGGGAGSVGGVNTGTSSNSGGPGGSGLSYFISGTSQFYAGGGGGGSYFTGEYTGGLGGSGVGGNGSSLDTGTGTSGIPNTGSGGGGGFSTATGNGSNGTVIVRYPAADYNVELLIVGGGGGGGCCSPSAGGGGGGLLYYSSYPVSAGTKYSVTVGAAGTGANPNGNNGGNSIFGPLVVYGGGGGAYATNGLSGGSGGGGGYSNTSGGS